MSQSLLLFALGALFGIGFAMMLTTHFAYRRTRKFVHRIDEGSADLYWHDGMNLQQFRFTLEVIAWEVFTEIFSLPQFEVEYLKVER